MAYSIEPVSSDRICREALISFLLKSPGAAHSEECWRARLKHWWDDNPVLNELSPLGWMLFHESQVVGFLGCVPFAYELQGEPVPAVAATTWRVADNHRGQSLGLFLPLLQLSKQMMVIHSSPIPAVAAILEKSGFQFRKTCMRHYHLMGALIAPLASLLIKKGAGTPAMDSSVRVISDIELVASIAATSMHREQLERKITLNYLKWLIKTPMEQLRFVGCVDRSGVLSSFLVLKPCFVKGLPAWCTIDWFTSRDNTDELMGLARAICRRPGLVSVDIKARVWISSSFENDDIWESSPAVLRRFERALYYYKPPPHLKEVSKYFVLAESDYVL